MKKYNVKISSLAFRDMEEIYSYMLGKLGSPTTAMRQFDRIASAIELLNIYPERFRVMNLAPELSQDVRQVIADNYSIFYVIGEDAVTVVRVLYSTSDVSAKLQNFDL